MTDPNLTKLLRTLAKRRERSHESEEVRSKRRKANAASHRKKYHESGNAEKKQLRTMYQKTVSENGNRRVQIDLPADLSPSMATAMKTFFTTIMLPWNSCNCCLAWRRVDKLHPAKGQQLIWHHLQASDSSDKRLCSRCHRFKPTEKRPYCPFSTHNLLQPIKAPPELQDLSYAELQVIRRTQPFHTLIILPKGQQGAKGQIVHLPVDVNQTLLHLLPIDPKNSLMLVNQQKPKSGATGRIWQLRLSKVIRALQWLKENNVRYRQIELNTEINKAFQDWLFYPVTVEDHPDKEPIDVDAADQSDLFDESVFLDMELRTLPPNLGQPLSTRSEWTEADSYPHLLPTGQGGERDSDRLMPLNCREYTITRLLSRSTQFQSDCSWPFRALINVNQLDLFHATQFILHQAVPFLTTRDLTAEKLLQLMQSPETDHTRIPSEVILNRFYRIIGRNIRGTAHYWKSARNHLQSMVKTLGWPTFFLTFGSNDLHWLDLFHAMDSVRFATQDDIDSLSHSERVGLLNEYPAIAAEHFSNRVRALVTFLQSESKPLKNRVTDYFFRIEFQKRGSPHIHGFVWVEGVPNPLKEPEQYLHFVDSVICAELPNDSADPELMALVKQCQFHNHTFTCQQNQSKKKRMRRTLEQAPESHDASGGEVNQLDPESGNPTPDDARIAQKRFFAEQNERAHCRFGFPHPCCLATHFRTSTESKYTVHGDRPVILRRRKSIDRHINPYNVACLRVWQANMDIQPISDPFAAIAYALAYITKDEKSELQAVKEAMGNLPTDSTTPKILSKLGQAILSFREVSKQEAMFLLLGEPLYISSRSTVFVPAFLPTERLKTTVQLRVLQNRELDSTDVWACNILDHYMARPHSQHWDEMTLWEFSSWFELCSTSQLGGGVDGDVALENADSELSTEDVQPTQSATEPKSSRPVPNPQWRQSINIPPFLREASSRKLPRWKLGNERWIRMRRKPKCVRAPLSDTQSMSTKYAMLLLHVPFREEYQDLLTVAPGTEITEELVNSALQRMGNTIVERSSCLPTADMNRVRELMMLFQSELALHERVSSAEEIYNDDMTDVESEPMTTAVLQENPAPSMIAEFTMRSQQLSVQDLVDSLTGEQKLAYQTILQYLNALDAYHQALFQWNQQQFAQQALPQQSNSAAIASCPMAPSPPRIFITGPGGTGKSYLIHALVAVVRQWTLNRSLTHPCPSGGVLLVAPTGIAAFNIGGTSIHHAFRIRPEKTGKNSFQSLRGVGLATMKQQLKNLTLVIVDEVSMVSSHLFLQMHKRLNQIFEVSDGFFGQRAIILVGDLAQLPPVCGKFVFADTPHTLAIPGFHLFRSLFHPIFLSLPQRQRDDEDFAHMLNRIRLSDPSPFDVQRLHRRSLEPTNPELESIEEVLQTDDWKAAIRILPRKKDVKAYNKDSLKQLASRSNNPLYCISATDRLCGVDSSQTQDELLKQIPKDPDKTAGLQTSVRITIGAPIMLRYNLNVADGLYNGARGEIVGIEWLNNEPPSPPEQQLHYSVRRRTQLVEIRTKQMPTCVLIHFFDERVGRQSAGVEMNGFRAIRIQPIKLTFEINRSVTVERTQLPLLEAFAITVHKSQSLTLPHAVVDCGRSIFQAGMAYTALSRVRKLSDLVLLNLGIEKLFMQNRAVKKEYLRLESLQPPSPTNHWGTDFIPDGIVNEERDSEEMNEALDEAEECETFGIPEED